MLDEKASTVGERGSQCAKGDSLPNERAPSPDDRAMVIERRSSLFEK